ncbi:MAG: transposase [Anaerolineae bacterium]|nr:transposase [Anaerolineae bacterium]
METDNETKPRRQFSAETKLQILKEGCTTNLTISQVCDQYQISPTLFYQWERIADRAAMSALQGQPRGRKELRSSEEALLAEVLRLREVIAELSSENLQLKKGRWR